MVRTSLNLHVDVFARLKMTADAWDASIRDVIVCILKKVMNDIEKFPVGTGAVKYQERDSAENWHNFCIRFKPDEFDFFTDLRKFNKHSLSLLVALAVKRYLSKISKKRQGGRHNYVEFHGYTIYRSAVNRIQRWHIYWGAHPGRAQTGTCALYRRVAGG